METPITTTTTGFELVPSAAQIEADTIAASLCDRFTVAGGSVSQFDSALVLSSIPDSATEEEAVVFYDSATPASPPLEVPGLDSDLVAEAEMHNMMTMICGPMFDSPDRFAQAADIVNRTVRQLDSQSPPVQSTEPALPTAFELRRSERLKNRQTRDPRKSLKVEFAVVKPRSPRNAVVRRPPLSGRMRVSVSSPIVLQPEAVALLDRDDAPDADECTPTQIELRIRCADPECCDRYRIAPAYLEALESELEALENAKDDLALYLGRRFGCLLVDVRNKQRIWNAARSCSYVSNAVLHALFHIRCTWGVIENYVSGFECSAEGRICQHEIDHRATVAALRTRVYYRMGRLEDPIAEAKRRMVVYDTSSLDSPIQRCYVAERISY